MLFFVAITSVVVVAYFMTVFINAYEANHDRLRQSKKALLEANKSITESNTTLEKVAQLADKANASKSEFLSRMSHELRTPLNAILGFAQLLEMDADKLDKAKRSNIQEILVAGKHLLHLINDVLDLSKIEYGKLHVAIEHVAVDEILPQCLTLIENQANERGLQIIDHISGKGYELLADPLRFKQVLLNLLSNAVKYNRIEGCITLHSDVIDERCLRLYVTDTGEGLSAGDLSKLFSSFERLNTSYNIEGVGIGLVISKHLMKLMGGSIGVYSTEGKGSVFWIELKLVENNKL